MLVSSLVLATATVLGHTAAIPEQDPRGVLAAMDRAVAGVSDYTMTLVSQEWRDDKLGPEQVLAAKWARPFRAYFKRLCEPNKGREILYAAGWNQGRLKVSLNTWPKRIRLNLDPHGDLAMAGTRHPVDETSIVYLANVVSENFRRADERGEATGADLGFETILGRRCRKLHLEIRQAVTTRVLGHDETLWDVGRGADLAMAPLLHENRAQGWKTPGDAKPGATVRIPRYYAAKIDLWIDDELNLPLRAEIFDSDGNMFERFEHRDLRVNVGLGSEDFSHANPGYRF